MDVLRSHREERLAATTADRAGLTLGSLARPHRTLWRDAWHRLIANRLALAGGIVVVLIALMAIFAPLIAPYPYDKPNYSAVSQFPNRDFPMGTDLTGRDVLSRMIYGAQVSMLVGLGAQVIVFLIGVPIGALSGYTAGKVDTILMRFVEVMYAFPQLLFVILIMAALGRGLQNIFIAIGVTGWVTIARLTRAEFLSIREKDYIQAARAAGASPWRLITRHMLPNALTPIIVALTFGVPEAIFTEAGLSFIGVGINPPRPSWGQMVGEYYIYLQSYWYLALFPAIAIALLMMSFTFFGNGLRDALDPRMQQR
ncbi:MAG: ABC transporter permease [Sphaerobacter sp.]|nr:ABC transporter permease [Sphaerobacter sp.]